MLKVHHLNDSRSQRVLWLLEELNIDYEIVHHQRDPQTRLAPESLKGVHPLGKSPVLEHDGAVIAETGTIIEYILALDGTGKFDVPTTSPDYWQYRFYMHHAEGSAMPPLVMKTVFDSVTSRPMPFFAKPIAKRISDGVLGGFVLPQLEKMKNLWNADLQKTGWFAGADISAADIMMSFPVEAIVARTKIGPEHSALKDFVARTHARPAYRTALERGGPYSFAK